MKYYLVASWPPWMQPLSDNWHYQMKVMRVVQTLLTCLLHSEKCQEFTMCPASNMLHLTLISHAMKHVSSSTQTSMQTTIVQFIRWQWHLRRCLPSSQNHSSKYTSIPRRSQRRGRRLPNSTIRRWTLDYRGSAQWNSVYTWTCLTTQTMSVSMPLCKLPNSFLWTQSGLKWHFPFWRHHDNIQWRRCTSTSGHPVLIRDWFYLKHYIN